MKILRLGQLLLEVCLFVVFAASFSSAATVPTGFIESPVASGLASPTSMQFAPDGRLFICEQEGRLRVVKNGALLPTPFLTLSVSSTGERGLLGVAFDPAFATNRYVYVYYTTTTPVLHNRISRFTANGDVAVAGSEVVLFDLDPLSLSTAFHNGGAIAFGADGKLYAAVGDNTTGANAQSMTTVFGKILRLNADGTIPADNPFYGSTTGKNRAIWALGLRNPFSFAFNPGGTQMFINDVGETYAEEINDGQAGANYGWPNTEGPTTDSRYVSPLSAYYHTENSCAITGGAFYSPLTAQFPAEYAGDYFFADYCAGWIRTLDPANDNLITGFATGIASPVDLRVSDDGSLYYLARGTGLTTGTVTRVARTTSAPTITTHPLSVTARPGTAATFSVDAAGTAPLRYQWQRNGVNISGATARTYTVSPVAAVDNGARFRVIVSNDSGNALSNEALLTVTVNQAPSAQITSPAAGTLYSGGTVITYAGTATDPEDGTLAPAAFTWWVDFHHDTHLHPFLPPTSGACGGSFTVPTTGHTEANVWYRIHLTVQDSNGLTFTTERDVLPRKVQLTLATNPPGLQIRLDDQPISTPLVVDSVVGIERTIEGITPQTAGDATYTFSRWSDGGALKHLVATPAASPTYTASYDVSGGGAPPAPIPIASPVNGLLATYFDTINFTGASVTRIDPTVDFDWAAGVPVAGIGADTFSVRWTGQVEAPSTETYRFYTQSDDGVRLWVNGQRLIDNWTDHVATENSGTIALTAGQRATIVMETYENGGNAVAKLQWSSPSIAKVTIPSARLYPQTGRSAPGTQTTFLSDLPWTSATSGWGPVERDQSNGESAAGDGRPLTINGAVFSKGLGMHAAADVRFGLPSGCSQFQAEVGLDAEVGSNGSAVFQVWGDSELLYTSPLRGGGDARLSVNLPLAGPASLQLVVLNGGDNVTSDHVDWAMARVSCAPTMQGVYLSNLEWTSAASAWGPVERDRSNGEAVAGDGRSITLNGATFGKGLGVHAPADVRFALPAGCSQFQAEVGVDGETGSRGSVAFEVWAGGVRLYASPLLTGSGPSASLDVPLSGQTDLRLVVTSGDDGIALDHADWAMAQVTCPPGDTIYLSDLPSTGVISGWGPIERDHSNGEAGDGDGRSLSLRGTLFGKGLGVHAPSQVRYALPGGCSQFKAVIGVDDEVDGKGSVTFEVWVGGVKAYSSGVLTGSDQPVHLTVPLLGQRDLVLVVDAGEDIASDHADWAMARLTCP